MCCFGESVTVVDEIIPTANGPVIVETIQPTYRPAMVTPGYFPTPGYGAPVIVEPIIAPPFGYGSGGFSENIIDVNVVNNNNGGGHRHHHHRHHGGFNHHHHHHGGHHHHR